MLQALPLDSVRPTFTNAAIRDTIAAIVKDAAYQRQLAQSYWDRILRWVGERLNELFAALGHSQLGRYLTIALLVILVGLIVARLIIGLRDESLSRSRAPRQRSSAASLASLSEAERLAAQGDYTAAAHALFAALLAASAARGELRLHPSKTTGDYARELRRRNVGWLRSFQSFRSRYDRVIYGDMRCSASDYDLLAKEVRFALSGERAA